MNHFNHHNGNDTYDKEELAREEEAWLAGDTEVPKDDVPATVGGPPTDGASIENGQSPTGGVDSPEPPPPTRAELEAQCADLIGSVNVLDKIDEILRDSGTFAGTTTIVKILFLALITRHLQRPVSIAVRGESSSGKSFALKKATELASPEAVHVLSSMSEKALAYSDAEFSHRMIVLAENNAISGTHGAYLIRSLLSEGKLVHEYTDFEGSRGTVRIEKEGPTGLLTSTAGKIDYELGTRLLSVNVDEGIAATKAILESEARQAEGAIKEPDLAEFHALDRWVGAGQCEVVIPFASKIASFCNVAAVRMRRDFPAVLGLIDACALVHQQHRAVDKEGRVVADQTDYAIVYELVEDVIAKGSGQAIAPEIRETVEAVRELVAAPETPGAPITIAAISEHLGLHRTTISRRLGAAIKLDLVVDVGKRGGPREIKLGEPLPEDRGVLPSPDELDLD